MKILKFSYSFLFVFIAGLVYGVECQPHDGINGMEVGEVVDFTSTKRNNQLVGCELLTYVDFLNKFKNNNNEFNSLQLKIEAEECKVKEEERAYSYFLNLSGAGHFESGKSKILAMYTASVDKVFTSGTKVSWGLCNAHRKIIGAKQTVPFMNISQSLLKDMNGLYTKSNIAKKKASVKSAAYLMGYEKQKILLNAKLIYWNLSYTKMIVEFRKTSLERAKKILEWNKKRYDMDLVEKSDLLQSQAAVKQRELCLKSAYEEENKANRLFNQSLNIKDEHVKYDVEKFKNRKDSFSSCSSLNRKNTRVDVLAALEKVKEAFYDEKAFKKRTAADLILSMGLAFNGLYCGEEKFESNTNKLSSNINLKWILPLDFKLRKVLNQGYYDARVSAQKSLDFAVLKENNEWLQLVDDWNNAKARLELAIEIEIIQQQRHQECKNLLNMGRSATHLVLQVEQDLDDATLGVLKNVFELIKIYEQAETFYN